MAKKYKAILCDLDGTLIPNKRYGMPSPKVIDIIKKAKRASHVGVATSRSYQISSNIINKLELSGPSILCGGAQIIEAQTGKILLQHVIPDQAISRMYDIAKRYGYTLLIDEPTQIRTVMNDSYRCIDPIGAFFDRLPPEIADQIVTELSQITDVCVHKVASWDEGKLIIGIGNIKSTKQYGVIEVADLLDISPEEIIGIGDGYNDLPLLQSCGFKVAMGNAVDELKAVADYVAPSVEEDGVADVIEKFLLR